MILINLTTSTYNFLFTSCSYLNEALLAINMSDPITREHAPKVLSELYRNCQLFIKNCPKSPQCSNVRLLIAMCSATYRDQFK